MRHRKPRDARSSRGQSVVEFALFLPLILIIFLAVADFARLFTSMMTIEAAAREAADFGSWKSSYWIGDPTDPDSNAYKTLQGMTERACIAARSLPDYEGPDTACTNPSMTVELQEADGTTGSNCDDPDRTVPCRVVVTMTHTFHLIVPVNIHLFDVTVGFPSDLTFSRTSIFAISDFAIDETP